jgi:serine/threonine protein kinase
MPPPPDPPDAALDCDAPPSDAEDSRVAAALKRYLTAQELGEPLDRAAFLAEHADIAGPLREALDGMELMQGTARQLPPSLDCVTDFLDEAKTDGTTRLPLGDFRIVREVGRGGMGIVYEAVQLSLDRRVALKVLPFASALDAKQLRRFRIESQAAAGLHHPHIVPVYAVGCERAVHYYAMQFIEGQSLAAVIHELRQLNRREPDGPGAAESEASALADAIVRGQLAQLSPPPEAVTASAALLSTSPTSQDPAFFRTAARLGIQVAEALAYAHDQGIIHRDIKPSNLLVDTRGNVWVSDFGLALVPGGGVTVTGDVVGTWRYMSPEQTSGERKPVDPRSDVYSLGATLYELLALEPVWPGKERAELVEQILHHEPRALTQCNPAVPRELETIVLKALAKEPDERYPSASELADDLQRYLDDRPILARRPTLVQHIRKWSKRHRGLLYAVGATLIVCLLAGSAFYIWSVRKEKQRADHNARLARRAVDELYTEFAERLTFAPGMQQVRKDFLKKALAIYEELSQEEGGDPETRFQVARASQRVGQIHQHLGESALASEAQLRAIRILEELVREFPSNPHYRYHLAMGFLMVPSQDAVVRDSNTRRGLDIMRSVAEDFPNDPAYQSALASPLHDRGQLLAASSPQEARRLLEEARAIDSRLREQYPQTAEYARNHGRDLHALARLEWSQGNRAAAAELFTRAVALREEGLQLLPSDVDGRLFLGHTLRDFGTLRLQDGDYEQARTLLHRSLLIFDEAANDYPDVPDYRADAGSVHHHLCYCLLAQGMSKEAKEHADAVIQRCRKLTQSAAYRWEGLRSLVAWHATSPFSGRTDAEQVLRTCDKAATAFPERATDLDCWRGVAQYRLGNFGQAVELLEKAVDPSASGQVVERYFLAMALWKNGDRERAGQEYQKAAQLQKRHGPLTPEYECWRKVAEAMIGSKTMNEIRKPE